MAQLLSFSQHDHTHCSGGIVRRAEEIADQKGLRLTDVRRRVLEILAEAHRAIGAYEVLDRLNAEGFGSQPPVAYRALDFLVENGFAHRVNRLNAFIACTGDIGTHAPVILICEGCDAVAELTETDTARVLRQEAGHLGFAIDRMSLEAVGICPTCEDEAP